MKKSKVSSRQLRAVELRDGESIRAAWVGGIAHGGTSNLTKIGGTLVLTDERVVFRPVKVPIGFIRWGDQRWIDGYGFSLSLDEVLEVAADPIRRAALVIRSADESIAINIGYSRLTPMWSKKNVVARDDAVARIAEAIGP